VKTFNQFHDGSFDGVLLNGMGAQFFFRTREKQSFVLRVSGLKSLRLNDFRQGNIIFDVLLREGTEVNLSDIVELYGFTDEDKAALKLEEAHREALVVLEINPSYGASCQLLATSVVLEENHRAITTHLALDREKYPLSPVERELLAWEVMNEIINGFHVDNFDVAIGSSRDQTVALGLRLRAIPRECEALIDQHEVRILRNALKLTLEELGSEFQTRTGFYPEEGLAVLDRLNGLLEPLGKPS